MTDKKENRRTNKYEKNITYSNLWDLGYMGCGNGFIVVDKKHDAVVSIAYSDCELDANGEFIVFNSQREGDMCEDAGRVVKEDDNYIYYRANFSCGEACLF